MFGACPTPAQLRLAQPVSGDGAQWHGPMVVALGPLLSLVGPGRQRTGTLRARRQIVPGAPPPAAAGHLPSISGARVPAVLSCPTPIPSPVSVFVLAAAPPMDELVVVHIHFGMSGAFKLMELPGSWGRGGRRGGVRLLAAA